MLSDAGVAGAQDSSYKHAGPAVAGDLATAWAVFQRFVQEPLEGDHLDPDGGDIAASYSTRGPVFEVSFGRGFVFEFDGEYSHSAILRVTFEYAATDDLRALESAEMYSDDEPLEEFLADVSRTPAFQIENEPTGIKVWYSDV